MAVGSSSRALRASACAASTKLAASISSNNPFAQLFFLEEDEAVNLDERRKTERKRPQAASAPLKSNNSQAEPHINPPNAAVKDPPQSSKNDAPPAEPDYGPTPCQCSGGLRNGRSSSKNAKKHAKAKEKKRRNQELQESDTIQAPTEQLDTSSAAGGDGRTGRLQRGGVLR